MFDITTLAVADTSFLHLRGPDNKPLFIGEGDAKRKVGVTLFSPGTEQFQEATTERQKKATDRTFARAKGDGGELTTAERVAERAAFLARCTAGFVNFAYPPASDRSGTALAEAVYANPKIGFIADQVERHLGEWSNFKPEPSAS
ncbi:hypothetical protein [Sphingomonas sp. ID0503]|uniref:hypothetical protein n=1 Tax=Sphingomonas sp. ID0503 TaxID=3399691 RepID=UPI003AFADC23